MGARGKNLGPAVAELGLGGIIKYLQRRSLGLTQADVH